MSCKVWHDISYLFPNFNAVEVSEWISNVIPLFTMGKITYPCWDLSWNPWPPIRSESSRFYVQSLEQVNFILIYDIKFPFYKVCGHITTMETTPKYIKMRFARSYPRQVSECLG